MRERESVGMHEWCVCVYERERGGEKEVTKSKEGGREREKKTERGGKRRGENERGRKQEREQEEEREREGYRREDEDGKSRRQLTPNYTTATQHPTHCRKNPFPN